MPKEVYLKYKSKKDENKSKIILVKSGDFFATYGNDAQIVADKLNLNIVSEQVDGEDIPITCFPAKDIENVLKELAEAAIDKEKTYVVLVVSETEDGKPYEYFVPATASFSDDDDSASESDDENTSDTEPSPKIDIVEATEAAKADEVSLHPNEVKSGANQKLHVPTYEELKQSELYMPIVDMESLTEGEIARAAQNKLSGEMDLRTFLYCWLHFNLRDTPGYAKQFLLKSKSLAKGIEYIQDHLKKAAKTSGSVGIGESKVIQLFLEYLRLDDAQIAAEKAKKEADRKAKAAEKAKQAKKNKSSAKASKSADKKDAAKGTTSSKKRSSAPKAATNQSVMSLFDMM